MLSYEEKLEFHNLHVAHEKVFQPDFGVYNDKSGVIRADINLSPVVPPPRKGKLPFYTQSNQQLLQDEADKLEQLGVLAKPEDVGVTVQFVSPSFLIKKTFR